MHRPPARLLQKRLKCAKGVNEVTAMEACEDAIRESGFAVASRAEHCLVLLPCPSLSWTRCLAPGSAHSSQDPSAGRGVTVELIPGGAEGGRLLVCMAAARTSKGKAFLAALRSRLKVAAHRAKIAGLCPGREVDKEPQGGFLRDTAVYYYVSRLLCSRRTGPGAKMAEFLQAFCTRYSAGASGMLPVGDDGSRGVPMVECNSAVDHLCKLIQESWGDAAATEVVGTAPSVPSESRLRACVERCLFTRVGPFLWRVYSGQHEAKDTCFVQRARALRALSDVALMQALEVREDLRGLMVAASPCSKDNYDAEETEATRSTAAGSEDEEPGECAPREGPGAHDGGVEASGDSPGGGALEAVAGEAAPSGSVYRRAAAALSSVEALLGAGHSGTPLEAVEALTLAHLEMKMCALEASGGSVELTLMEDVLPIFVFVLLRSSFSKPFTCARFLADAITSEETLNNEGKVVQLLEGAADYITKGCSLECI